MLSLRHRLNQVPVAAGTTLLDPRIILFTIKLFSMLNRDVFQTKSKIKKPLFTARGREGGRA
jgi:hypothetical protein